MTKQIRFLLFPFLLFLFSFGTLFSQAPVLDQSGADHVQWTIKPSKTSGFVVGETVSVDFTVNITSLGWHIYSSKPAPAGMGYNHTEFLLYDDESKGITLSGPLKEDKKPKVFFDEIMMDTVREFKESQVTFTQRFKITDVNVSLSGELSYQVCESVCIFSKLPFSWKVKAEVKKEVVAPIETTPEKSTPENPEKTESAPEKNPSEIIPEGSNQEEADSNKGVGSITEHPTDNNKHLVKVEKNKKNGYWGLFFKAFLFGFAALLTPCVFPMIPLTVTFFTKQNEKAGGNKNKGIYQALFYGLSIVGIYTGLGLTLAALFGDDVLYKMSINPWVNLGFFVLLFVFALSFLGMFEITLPSSWVNGVDEKSERGGLLGVFFMALTLALVSFSCTGPLVGTALIEAAQGGRTGPVVAMLGFSSAIAIPFCLFAIFPTWLNSLPKSGGWLNSVKVVLGLLEIALGLKFLSQTDLYMKWHILDREIFIGAWIVIFSIMGLYLIGKIRLPHDSKMETLSVPRLLLGMLSFWFVLYLVPGLWGARLPLVSGLLPPPNNDIGVRVLGQKESNKGTVNGAICDLNDRKYLEIFHEKETHGFCTFYDIEEASAYAKKVNKPLFLDFTGVTCANCRKVEQSVWPKPEISKLLKEDFVMVSLYADEKTKLEKPEQIGARKIRTIGDKWLAVQSKYFSMNAQPYYVILDPNYTIDNPMSLLTSPQAYTGDVELYKNFLESGKKAFSERKE